MSAYPRSRSPLIALPPRHTRAARALSAEWRHCEEADGHETDQSAPEDEHADRSSAAFLSVLTVRKQPKTAILLRESLSHCRGVERLVCCHVSPGARSR